MNTQLRKMSPHLKCMSPQTGGRSLASPHASPTTSKTPLNQRISVPATAPATTASEPPKAAQAGAGGTLKRLSSGATEAPPTKVLKTLTTAVSCCGYLALCCA